MTDSASQSLVDRRWTPEQFWEYLEAFVGDWETKTVRTMMADHGLSLVPAARITELEAERDRLAKRLDLLAVGVCDGGKYIADWQAKIAHFKRALAAESDLARLRGELDASNNNHRAMARQMAELGVRCKHAESEVSRVEGETRQARDYLAQIQAVCRDNAPDSCNHKMALKFAGDLTDAALRSLPPLAKRGDQKETHCTNPESTQNI